MTVADNPEDPKLSTEDLIFLLSNTHYRCLSWPLVTRIPDHTHLGSSQLVSHRKYAEESLWYIQQHSVSNVYFCSEQELKAWYKGFKRDCPRAQLSRKKVFSLELSVHMILIFSSVLTYKRFSVTHGHVLESRAQLQKVFLSPGTCFLRQNFPNIEEEFS